MDNINVDLSWNETTCICHFMFINIDWENSCAAVLVNDIYEGKSYRA